MCFWLLKSLWKLRLIVWKTKKNFFLESFQGNYITFVGPWEDVQKMIHCFFYEIVKDHRYPFNFTQVLERWLFSENDNVILSHWRNCSFNYSVWLQLNELVLSGLSSWFHEEALYINVTLIYSMSSCSFICGHACGGDGDVCLLHAPPLWSRLKSQQLPPRHLYIIYIDRISLTFLLSRLSSCVIIRLTFQIFREMSQQLLNFGTDIHCSQRMNPKHFGNPSSFLSLAPSNSKFSLILRYLNIWRNICTDVNGPQKIDTFV